MLQQCQNGDSLLCFGHGCRNAWWEWRMGLHHNILSILQWFGGFSVSLRVVSLFLQDRWSSLEEDYLQAWLGLCIQIVLLFLLSQLHWWGVIATIVQHWKKRLFCHLAMVGHFIPNPSIIIRWISRILQLLGRFRGLLSSQSIHCMHRGSMSSNITENYLGCNELWSFTMHMVTNCMLIEGLCKQVQNALKLIDQNLQRLSVGKCRNTMNLQLQHLVLWTKLNGNCNKQQFYEFQYGYFLTDLSTGCSTLCFLE
jgi:hypothetical protein